MKRAEQVAWWSLAGLLILAIILLYGAIDYGFTAFWAGLMLVSAQAMAVGLAAWGMALARQAAELGELPPLPGVAADRAAPRQSLGGFRLSGDDPARSSLTGAGEASETKTLDTGFQRLLVGITGFLMTALGGLSGYLVYRAYDYSMDHRDQPLAIAGSFDKPQWLDELALVIGLAGAAIYCVLYWASRPVRTRETDEAVSSNFTLGITPMIALGVATILGYFRVSFASEFAAGIVAFFLLLQGLELLVNACRSYSNIEELDQDAIDLQATPLCPMIGSVWLAGLRMLFAQSLGLSDGGKGRDEKGVIARMMPRALLSILVIAIGVSCIRVVRPGEVAVLERLGFAPVDALGRIEDSAILQPGLHFTFPWPVDRLVMIPNQQLQLTDVGAELHAPEGWGDVGFAFWTVRDESPEQESEDLFITGDPGSAQLLETFIQVRWRVADPARFYTALSHSEFFRRERGTTRTLPIYEAIIKECTNFAVTRTFAIHSLEHIMILDRPEVERHCHQILQDKLDAIGSGIQVEYMTIKDLHPPYWRADRMDPTKDLIAGERIDRGPASAFEFVVSMREYRERLINEAEAEAIAEINIARGDAGAAIAQAHAYRLDRIARAHGEADRLQKMTEGLTGVTQNYHLGLLQQQLLYATLREVLNPVNKIIVDPQVRDIQIYQTTEQGLVPLPLQN